jgi:hypothetical protein
MMDQGFAQIRPQGGGMPYAPLRDLVNIFPQLARRSAYLLAREEREESFNYVLEQLHVDEQQLVEAAKALALYINNSTNPDIANPLEALDKSGFNLLNSGAQTAILARLGQTLMAMFFVCVRDAMRPNAQPLGLDQFISEITHISKLIHPDKI